MTEIKAYISGALSGIPNPVEIKGFYERIAEVCAAEKITAYVPHLITDPITHPHITPQEVYELDRAQVLKSDLLIAYAGIPSFGVGQEIEIARQRNIPVILLVEADAVISRMARGNPAVIAEIRFKNHDDALQQLAEWLHEWRL
jgi:nucleoside 2-deoxyribosyltransferase